MDLGRRQGILAAVPVVSSVITCRKTFCPSLSSLPTMGKQKEAETFWSSCLVPQLFLEKLVSNTAGECESVCVCACTCVVFLLCEQRNE